ncbi:hypothetical protein [Fastidiosibacter lacustris]|nr:hypothetical protein [Fastidiosibacter lacustris]
MHDTVIGIYINRIEWGTEYMNDKVKHYLNLPENIYPPIYDIQ